MQYVKFMSNIIVAGFLSFVFGGGVIAAESDKTQ